MDKKQLLYIFLPDAFMSFDGAKRHPMKFIYTETLQGAGVCVDQEVSSTTHN